MKAPLEDRSPVIVGIGEIVEREDGDEARPPRDLVSAAILAADVDAGGGLAALADRLEVIQLASFAYLNLPQLLADDIGASPSFLATTPLGGDMPVKALADAAEAIASGRSQIAIICGGEALKTRMKAAQERRALTWAPADPDAPVRTGADYVTANAARYRLTQPMQVYPLYENATRWSWRQTLSEAQAESASLWARLSSTAADNPAAWAPCAVSADAIATVSADNRLISFPYPKLMNAQLGVNQAAALLLTDVRTARAAGISDDRMIRVGRAVRAVEPSDFLARDRFDRSAAQEVVLETVLTENDIAISEIDLMELYSCFPVVPKLARRALGLGADFNPSVAGGLTFFGGPANNYMTHAIAAAVRGLRGGKGDTALLYGQGEFVTKHAAILLSRYRKLGVPGLRDVQAEADERRDAVPPLVEDYAGPAILETFTVLYDRGGQPEWAPVVLRTPGGERVLAATSVDEATIARLTHPTANPIGLEGMVTRDQKGLLLWTI